MTAHATDRRLDRRAFILCGAALAASPALARPMAPAGGKISFDVYRKDRKIGEHLLTFAALGDALTMTAHVQMAVSIGPITVFRYRHQQTETWQGDRFASLATSTVQNGDHIEVEAQRTDAGVRLQGNKTKGVRMLAAEALPLTHWNRASLDGPLFNPQDGKLMRLSITKQGPSALMLGDGRQISATRIALAGETSIEDWYDQASAWTGLRAKALDGSIVEYRRV